MGRGRCANAIGSIDGEATRAERLAVRYAGERGTTIRQATALAKLQRWPDLTDDEDEESPWSDGPLINNATGPIFYFGMSWSLAQEVSTYAAELARAHGLVCYDPQAEALR